MLNNKRMSEIIGHILGVVRVDDLIFKASTALNGVVLSYDAHGKELYYQLSRFKRSNVERGYRLYIWKEHIPIGKYENWHDEPDELIVELWNIVDGGTRENDNDIILTILDDVTRVSEPESTVVRYEDFEPRGL